MMLGNESGNWYDILMYAKYLNFQNRMTLVQDPTGF